MTALQWIVKEAKAQKNKYPTKFKTWKEYIKQASKQYNTGIKPSFPKKNKVGVVKKKAVPKKKIGNMKVAKYKVGQKVYSYQNKDYSAPINKLVYSPWNNSGKYDKRDTYKYVLSLKDGNSNYIDEKSISKKSIGAVKKKAATKNKAAKKKIGYSKVRLEQEKGITKVLKNTPKTLFPYTAKEKIVKAGKKYFDQEAKKIGNIIIGKAKPSIISLAKKISKLTDYNDHNKSILSNKNAIDKMNYISKMHDSYGYMPNELDNLRIKILEDLFTMFKNKYGQIDYRLIKDSF